MQSYSFEEERHCIAEAIQALKSKDYLRYYKLYSIVKAYTIILSCIRKSNYIDNNSSWKLKQNVINRINSKLWT